MRSLLGLMRLQGLLIAFAATTAVAAGRLPECIGRQGALPVMNEQVVKWKFGTPNQFQARALVEGRVVEDYVDRNDHEHFVIQIGARPQDTLEVVYNLNFGDLPRIRVGMVVSACGDYITSNAPTHQYPASPVGAIIHWVHFNPKPQGHPHGYLVIDGVLYGNKHADRPGFNRRPHFSHSSFVP